MSEQASLQLEFAVFCIENVAEHLGRDPVEVYDLLAKKSSILKDYIFALFDVLHTQGRDYIVEDIEDVMRSEGVLP